jgi:hypothetical protein
MDSDKGIAKQMLQDSLIPAWQLCKMMQVNSEGAFTADDFREQFDMRIEIDSKTMFRPDSTQDEFFSYIAEISQCDHCGTGTPPTFPKMLTCSACKSVHYCDKECQRQHWKNGHKAMCMGKTIPKDVFRVAYFCSKVLAFLSLGLDAGQEMAINADASHLRTVLLKSGCRNNIYMPAFEEGVLMYIPMPQKFVPFFATGADRQVSKGNGLDSFDDRDQHITIAVQTKIPINSKEIKDCVFIMTATAIRLS